MRTVVGEEEEAIKRLLFVASLAFALCICATGYADLINNGGGLIYDTSLNITWYDYTYTGPQGLGVNWYMAESWAGSLNVGGVTGWRLPQALPVNGSSYNNNSSYDGSTDVGYNITSPNSEMAYLFYVDLRNKGYFDANGKFQPGYGLVNYGPFQYLPGGDVFSGMDNSGTTWGFDFVHGYQYSTAISNFNPLGADYPIALAVHSGDVGGPVPLPGSILLFVQGLSALVVVGRRFKR